MEDDEDGDDDATAAVVGEEGGDEAANARKPLADLMRGEMVGVNCDFSAVIEVQVFFIDLLWSLSLLSWLFVESPRCNSFAVVVVAVVVIMSRRRCCSRCSDGQRPF